MAARSGFYDMNTVAYLNNRKTTIAGLASEIIQIHPKVHAAERAIVSSYTSVYRARVQMRIQGPGPAYVRRVTGAYWRGIKTEIRPTPVGVEGEIYTDSPQARRLEFGFVGADSLGRHYHQGPRPHWFAESILSQTWNQMHDAMFVYLGTL